MTNPPKLLIVRSHSSLPGLETPLCTQQLNTCPVQHVLVKQGWGLARLLGEE